MSNTATAMWPDALRDRGVPWTGCAGHIAVALSFVWFLRSHAMAMVIVIAGTVVLLMVWRHKSPDSFVRWLAGPLLGRLWLNRIRRNWDAVSACCDQGGRETATIRRTRRRWPRIELIVRPSPGQTLENFEKAAEAIRLAVGAATIRVAPFGHRDISVEFTIGDSIVEPFDAQPPDRVEDLESVVMGRRSDGEPWRLRVGPHTLVAGSSGSGKGSLFWSFAFALAPAIHAYRVQLHGIDLKGGMEILMGEDLFTTQATSPAEAVVVLEMLVEKMRQRTRRLAGRRRAHKPSIAEPLHVVMIDELAVMTAYCPERDLQRRAENALNLLCSQGRAPGFMVFACLQDPRKEVIPSRGLFTQMVGLRLKDLAETSMVLGESAVFSGAHCHRISSSVPGTGYAIPEDGGHPIRVRAGFASDRAIREVARRYATPTQIPIDASAVEHEVAARQIRRERQTRGAA
jgi:S-DNA-T family DNA segregation ATPase FtsK/SpoIIIE